MTDYKAIADLEIKSLGDGKGKKSPEFHKFSDEVMQSEGFAEIILAAMMDGAKKFAGIVINSESKEDAMATVKLKHVNRPLMELAWIAFEMGRKAAEAESMEKMFGSPDPGPESGGDV